MQGGALLAELLTQIARAACLQRRFHDADRTLDDAEAALPPSDERGRVRLVLERGRVANTAHVDEEIGGCLLALGRPDEAAASFARAFELLSPSLAASDPEPRTAPSTRRVVSRQTEP